MVELLAEKPGLLFVAATLLPLASFTLLLLLGATRWALRPHAGKEGTLKDVFEFLGGSVPGPGPAYVALGAIVLAFVCSLAGFIQFAFFDAPEMHKLEQKLAHVKHDHARNGHADQQFVMHEEEEQGAKDDKKADDKKAKAEQPKDEKGKDAKKDKDGKEPKKEEPVKPKVPQNDRGRYNELKERWEGNIEWARVLSSTTSDADRGAILNIGFRIDMLSAVMFVMVTFVASLIHLFSIGYMADELKTTVEDHEVHTAHGHYERRGRFGRFFMFLSLFCFSMLNLLLADNLFQIFVSWELVGVCSYLLIGFYFERTSASNASNKAFITNRIGDAGFIIGMLIIWSYFGTFNFEEIFSMVRCPERDAHGAIKLQGKNIAKRIVRGTPGDAAAAGYRFMPIEENGSDVLLFPRKMDLSPFASKKDQFVGPKATQRVYDQPEKTQYSHMPYWLLVVAGLGIFLGCVGKSAQFPLQVWLPDAMEGPTPVSALIHAATMVAAGVYLVGRAYPLFTPEVLLTIAYVGGITLFVAATIAIVATDIKKVLAYSTVSQLGYMMLALGVGGWTAGQLHLLTHAFFKALLFLGSGSVIYGCHHEQNMEKMGGLYPKMKITAITMLMGVLAIAGTPLFSGWYSKDEILASAFGFAMTHKEHFLLFVLPLVTAGITTFYMFRMWFLTFTGKPRDEHVHDHAHESPWMMTVPLILLAILSVGVAWGWPPHHPADSWLGQQLHHYSAPKSVEMRMPGHDHPIPVDVDFVAETRVALDNHNLVGVLALGMVAIGLVFALVLYYYGVLDPDDAKEQFPGVYAFLVNKWYFDELYSAVLVRPGLTISHWAKNFDTYVIDGFVNLLGKWNLVVSSWSGWFDRGIVDGFVNLLAEVSYAIGAWLRNFQTGYIRSYILFLALAAMALWVLLYAWGSTLFGGQ
jgi:NADH-quinone oxidoreductase subunit L